MRIALAQINPTIGDFQGNIALIRGAYERATERKADLVVAPELAVSGYPPMDLLERVDFIERSRQAVDELAKLTASGPALIVGFADRNESNFGNPLHNGAAVCEQGRLCSIHRKSLLPTYDVFDERRYFEPARKVRCATVAGVKVAVTICEDLWLEDFYWQGRSYGHNPLAELMEEKPRLIVNLSASPWHMGKCALRHTLCRRHARRFGVPVALVNQVGGADELIFDGTSFVVDPTGGVRARGYSFEQDLVVYDMATGEGEVRPEPEGSETGSVYKALQLGLRDYFKKTGGFTRAVVGLSGGIDSSVVAALAADTLGPENVLGVRMPSPFSSVGSLDDAEQLATNLGIDMVTLPIDEPYASLSRVLEPVFAGRPFDVAEENLQARVRGVLLMGISNKLGHIVLSTGNKSELAVGYCTLYGDMSGGLALISDVPKTLVYALARFANRHGEKIPQVCIDKPPSAELRPDQLDSDSLPPYDVLDALLHAYIEEGCSRKALIKQGFDGAVVDRVITLVQRSEYKRRQSAPGFRVTHKAFGVGRRIPLAQRYGD